MIGWKASAPCPAFPGTQAHRPRGKLWANSRPGTHVTASFLCKGERGLRGVGGGWLGEGGGKQIRKAGA